MSTSNELTMKQFQDAAKEVAIYRNNTDDGIGYTSLGLVGEAGEVANKVKKWMRGDMSESELKKVLLDELGDVLWYVAMLSHEAGWELEQVAQRNIDKLSSRKARGKLKGDGDER